MYALIEWRRKYFVSILSQMRITMARRFRSSPFGAWRNSRSHSFLPPYKMMRLVFNLRRQTAHPIRFLNGGSPLVFGPREGQLIRSNGQTAAAAKINFNNLTKITLWGEGGRAPTKNLQETKVPRKLTAGKWFSYWLHIERT